MPSVSPAARSLCLSFCISWRSAQSSSARASTASLDELAIAWASHDFDRCDRSRLPFAPDAADALLELRRIPGQVEIDDAIRRLKIESRRAGIRRKKRPAGRILPKADDLGAAAQLRHVAGVPGAVDAHLGRQFAYSALTEVGETTSTRSTPFCRASNSQAAIACTILPIPISSASSARS
jgi:hypothetical protein